METQATRMNALHTLDVDLFHWINSAHVSPALDQLMLFLSGRVPWLVVGVGLLLWAAVRRNGHILRFCLLIGIAIGLSDALSYQLLKPAFARERPCYQLEDVRLVQERCGSDYGFPSNHAANSMATAVAAMLWLRRRLALGLVFLAIAIGWSRVYLGVHFPGDVLMGYVVGACCGVLIYGLFARFTRRPLFGRKCRAHMT